MYFPHFSCFWDVMCHTFAWELLLESLVNLSCDGICCIIFWHSCIWIHLSILWSTVGRCETFDKLWLVYFVTSFKVIKAHLRLVVPLEFWTFYDVISMVCKRCRPWKTVVDLLNRSLSHWESQCLAPYYKIYRWSIRNRNYILGHNSVQGRTIRERKNPRCAYTF